LVKVASETLTEERFYDRCFALIDRFLVPEAVQSTPVAPPALPAPSNEAPLREVPLSPSRG
jgi:hypothetical protein